MPPADTAEKANTILPIIVIVTKNKHLVIESATSLFTFLAYFIQINIGIIVNNNMTMYNLSIYISSSNTNNPITLYPEMRTCQLTFDFRVLCFILLFGQFYCILSHE